MTMLLPEIRQIAEGELEQHLPAFAALLIDAVDAGASVGFLPPMSEAAAGAYWEGVYAAVRAGGRILLAAFEDGEIVGAVQLDLAGMPNGSHRAEVMKLFVHRQSRRRGIARVLMAKIEECARKRGRSLLVLDTRAGDSAEKLYERIGYVKAGIIPRYARSASGDLDGTVIMYRWLELGDGAA